MSEESKNNKNTENPQPKKRGGRKKETPIIEPEVIKEDEVAFSAEDEKALEDMGKSLVDGFDALLQGITEEIEKIDFSQFTQELATETFEFDEDTPLETLKEKRKNAKTKINELQVSLAEYIENALTQIATLKKHAKKLKKQIKKKK